MEALKFNYRGTCGISTDEILRESKRLEKVLSFANEATKTGYATDFASINVPSDKTFLEGSKKLAERFKDVKLIVVVGIGGSNLGTVAVQQAIQGKITSSKTKILYADTVDSDYIANIITVMERELKAGNEIVLNCITKSGTTVETIANFLILLNVLKKYKRDYNEYVVVTTDKHSKFYFVAKKEEFHILELPVKVGGRYSAFTHVGLFPLALIGVSVNRLIEGAKSIKRVCLSTNILKNPAALSALIMFLQYRRGKNIANLFLFSNELEGVGKWYRQLMGESIGKERDFLGRLINAGLTPTIAIGSTDLHSMVQLYLGGPNDKITTFITLKNVKNKLAVPKHKDYMHLARVQGKNLSFIMNAISGGAKKAYLNKHLPYMDIELTERSEYCIGQIMQMKMFEMIYLGYLLNVNPFDQPNVEEYKEETRKLLK